MMFVFTHELGDYTVEFYFDRSWDVRVGEIVSQLGVIFLVIFAFASIVRKR